MRHRVAAHAAGAVGDPRCRLRRARPLRACRKLTRVTLGSMRRFAVLLVCATLLLAMSTASASAGTSVVTQDTSVRAAAGSAPGASGTSARRSSSQPANPDAPIPVPASNKPPAGRRLSANGVLAIAGALPKMKAVRAKYPRSFGGAYLKLAFRWQVSYFSRNGKKEIGQAIVDDLSGRVLEQWTGFQVAWTMARGYPWAFGRHVNALYVWVPLCVLFLFPFIDFRRPFSLLHLDLLVLLSFSISLAFFNHARIYASVPLTYPPLLYLLARMLALSRPGASRSRRPLRLNVPPSWLAFAIVFLVGFRIALNFVDSNVIDVGYAGVIGAQRIVQGKPLYGSYPADNEHGDTYGPVNYEAYVPFQQVFGWSGHWDDLPAAHAAAVAFDVLALAPLLATHGLSRRGAQRGAGESAAGGASPAPRAPPPRRLALFLGAFALAGALACVPALSHDSLHTIYQRTLAYQADRGSPFSVWGLYGGLAGVEGAVQAAAIVLAVALALIPRSRDLVALAAACAAVILAAQLGHDHWFYLYIPWFAALVLLALLGSLSPSPARGMAAASEPARSSRPAVAVSSG